MIFGTDRRLEIGVPTTPDEMYVDGCQIDPQPVVPIREATLDEWLKWDRDFRTAQGKPWPGDAVMAMMAYRWGYTVFYEVATD